MIYRGPRNANVKCGRNVRVRARVCGSGYVLTINGSTMSFCIMNEAQYYYA